MSYNPYEAPKYAAPAAGPAAGGPQQPWELGDILSETWRIFTAHWVTLVFSFLLSVILWSIPLIGLVGAAVAQVLKPETVEFQLAAIGVTLVSTTVRTFLEAGITRMWLVAARGGSPEIGQMFSGGDRFLPLLGLSLLLGVGGHVGSLVAVAGTSMGEKSIVLLGNGLGYLNGLVVLVLVALGLMFAQYFIVDAGHGPISGISAAWRSCAGQRGKVLAFGVVDFLIVLAGLLVCCVGMIVSSPLASLAVAVLYTRISGRTAPEAPTLPFSAHDPYGPR
jgi:hypothetical protein